MPVSNITKEQMNYIEHLVSEIDEYDNTSQAILDLLGKGTPLNKLTRSEASDLIRRLKYLKNRITEKQEDYITDLAEASERYETPIEAIKDNTEKGAIDELNKEEASELITTLK